MVEVDGTYIGGKRKNMSNAKRKALAVTSRGPVGKIAVVGVRRRGGKVRAKLVERTDAAALVGLVEENVIPGTIVLIRRNGPSSKVVPA